MNRKAERIRLTKKVLLGSKPWADAVGDIEIMKLEGMGVMDMDSWSIKDHHQAVVWASGRVDRIPPKIKAYLDGQWE